MKHWKSGILRISASILAVCMLLTACQSTPKIEHKQVNFSEITYERPDTAALDKQISEAMDAVNGGQDAKTVLALYDAIMVELDKIGDEQTVANIHSDLDVTDTYYQDEYTALSEYSTKVDNQLIELTAAILDSETLGSEAQKAWGDDYVARFQENRKLNDPQIEPLVKPETELTNKYKELLTKEYTTKLDDKDYTLNDLVAEVETLGVEKYMTGVMDILSRMNGDMGPIYLELSDYWQQEIDILGFDTVADYYYAGYSRDFTPEDALRLGEDVQKYLAPLSQEIAQKYDTYSLPESDKTPAEALDILQNALKTGYPSGMTEALNYMRTNEMYNYDELPNKMQGGYTTVLSTYGAPFMFIHPSMADPTTIFHEFGHYSNFYMTQPYRWNDNQSLDLAEVHSQGMELLMHDSYAELYGDQADAYKVKSLSAILDAVLQGFCEDRFQQQAQDGTEKTLEQVNQLHGQAYTDFFGYPDEYQWVQIHHHFESPFYYVSYGTSALAALSIWDMAQQDRGKAMKAYSKLLDTGYNVPFRTALIDCGLSDPFAEGYVEEMANTLRKALGL